MNLGNVKNELEKDTVVDIETPEEEIEIPTEENPVAENIEPPIPSAVEDIKKEKAEAKRKAKAEAKLKADLKKAHGKTTDEAVKAIKKAVEMPRVIPPMFLEEVKYEIFEKLKDKLAVIMVDYAGTIKNESEALIVYLIQRGILQD